MKSTLTYWAVAPHVIGQLLMVWFVSGASQRVNGSTHFTLFDDAMISMTYGKTLAETGQLVWTPGSEVVQGFTNLFWTLYMSMLHAIGLEGSLGALAVQVTGAVLISLVSFQVQNLVEKHGAHNSTWIANSAALSVYLCLPLVFWTLRGMEVGLVASLFLLLVSVLSKIQIEKQHSPVQAALIIGIIGLGVGVRMDFAVPVIALILVSLLRTLSLRSGEARQLILLIVSLAFSLLIVLSIQNWLFGDFLPNTYFLKVDGHSFLERILRGSVNILKLVPLIAIVAWSWHASKKALVPASAQMVITNLSFSFLCVVAYSVYVGGDAWEYLHFANRFISGLLPGALVVISISATLGARLFTASRSGVKMFVLLLFVSSGALIGFQTNPIQFNVGLALLGVAVFATLIGVLFLVNQASKSKERSFDMGRSAAAIFVVLSSVTPALVMIDKGEIPFTYDDAAMTSFGLALSEATYEGASIATMWAGAPSYYSDRTMVDLLGKNDRNLARSKKAAIPEGFFNEEFWPGHNKYNLQYSIKTWSPTLVAQRLGLPGEEELLVAMGYKQYCLETDFGIREIYVVNGSTLVNTRQLKPCK